MKKLFSLFAAILFAGSMMATEVSITFSEKGLQNSTQYTSFDVDDVISLTFGGGGNTGKYYNTGTAIRVYGGGNMTVTAESPAKMTSIVLTFGTGDGNNAITVDNGTYSEGAWTGNESSVTFTVGGTSGHRRIASVTVTYTVGEEIAATAIELDQTALTLTEGETATLKATLTPANATTTVTWESSDEAVATVAAGKVTAVAAGTATITAKAGELSATCTVTVNEAPALTCAQANALADGANAKLGEFTVAYVNGAYAYICDASGYALIYKYDYGLKAGDKVNGFKGNMKVYNGLPELIPSVEYADLTITAGEAPAPVEFTAAPVAADVNKYIILKGVTMTAASFTNKNLTATIGDVNFTLRDNFSTSQTFDTEKTYDVVGAVSVYNTTVQVFFISATEQEEPVDPDQPSVTATPEEIEVTAEGFEGNTVTLEYANLGETFEVEATADAEWITNIAFNADNTELTFDVAANEGAARTATITITATGEGELEATATVTVSQAKYVKPIVPVTGGEFVKVTEEADVTDGAYLIVHEAESVAFNGSLATLDVANNNIAVTISENKIAATESTLAAVFYIETVEGGYSVRAANGDYIGVSSYDNGLKQADDVYVHNAPVVDESGNVTLSISGESWTNDMILCYNDASNQERFRYYKNGSQKAIQLYKHVSGTTAIDNTAVENKAVKTIVNGQLLITRDGKTYNILGVELR